MMPPAGQLVLVAAPEDLRNRDLMPFLTGAGSPKRVSSCRQHEQAVGAEDDSCQCIWCSQPVTPTSDTNLCHTHPLCMVCTPSHAPIKLTMDVRLPIESLGLPSRTARRMRNLSVAMQGGEGRQVCQQKCLCCWEHWQPAAANLWQLACLPNVHN